MLARGVSRAKVPFSATQRLDGLARLGGDVEIAVAPRRDATAGRIAVSFPDAR
ncbi:MAG: hypothetical protein U5O69_04745 [Candidatus Competibacteraceae bacterium]|nr:hypothetical protein [Candidatus Competibacteraceae bacterium]